MTQGEALDILKTGANIFLTGEPGSGKTHTLNAYVTWLNERGISHALTASTGIAATHVGGTTIHAWSGIGILDSLSPMDLDRIASKEQVSRRIGKAQVLIIDEISMLSSGVLSMVDEVMREIRRDHRAFGGVQVIFCGDFFQLPPVSRGGRNAEFAFNAASWKQAMPMTCYLTEQFRQEDEEFVSLLNSIRRGEFTHEDASTLLKYETDAETVEGSIPRLFTHNMDVDALNQKKLDELATPAHIFPMQSEGSQTLIESLKRGCLSPEKLILKKGAIVMCTKNNAAGGYANGTLGTVVSFNRGTGDPVIRTLDGRELTIAQSEWLIEEEGKVRARLKQIPLRLAWGITIHKSQGMSMDAAAIDLSKTFEYGQGYVALSRLRSLSGLMLLGWNENACAVHPEVMRIDERFREESDAVVDAFDTLRTEGDLALMQENFIVGSGGSLEKVTPGKKKTTYEETRHLLLHGMTLSEVAKHRNLTVSTVADHAGKLIETGTIDPAILLSAIPATLVAALPDIHQSFAQHGTQKLAPVYHAHFGKYTYDDLKIARALFAEGQQSEVY